MLDAVKTHMLYSSPPIIVIRQKFLLALSNSFALVYVLTMSKAFSKSRHINGVASAIYFSLSQSRPGSELFFYLRHLACTLCMVVLSDHLFVNVNEVMGHALFLRSILDVRD